MARMSKRYRCIFFFIAIILDFCGADRVAERIDVKILEKQYRFQEKNNNLESLKNSQDLVKNLYADLTSARTELIKTYKTYFIQKTMCQGLSENLEIIEQKSSIPDNVCLAPPLDPSAIDVFIAKNKLGLFSKDTEFVQSLVNEQTDFNEDVFNQAPIYTRISQIVNKQLLAVVQKNKDCLTNYTNTTNPNPTQCQPFDNQITRLGNIYNNERGRALSFGRLTRIPMFELERKQRSLDSANKTQLNFQSQLKLKEDELKINETSCNADLQTTKILLDSQLKSVNQIVSKITFKNAKISEFQSDLDSLLEEVKIITTYIKSQATDLKLENL